MRDNDDDEEDGDNDDGDGYNYDDSSTSHHTKQRRHVYLHLSFSDLLQRLRRGIITQSQSGLLRILVGMAGGSDL